MNSWKLVLSLSLGILLAASPAVFAQSSSSACHQIFEIFNDSFLVPTITESKTLNSLSNQEKKHFFRRMSDDALSYIRNRCLSAGGILTCYSSKNEDMTEQLWVRDNMIVLNSMADRLSFILNDEPRLKSEIRRAAGIDPRYNELKNKLAKRKQDKTALIAELKKTLLFWKNFHESPVPARDHGHLIWNHGYILTTINPGEPIATVSGDMVRKHWGAPQVDGPGYEGIAISKFFKLISKYATYDGQGDPEFLAMWPTQAERDDFLKTLYKKDLQTTTPLQGSFAKTAAEYLLHQALEARFDASGNLISIRFPKSKDLWEWTGLSPDVAHFHTNAIVYDGLKAIAEIADFQKDPLAAKAYRQAADRLKQRTLQEFWNPQRGIFLAHVHPELVPWKPDGFDLGVMEGILGTQGDFVSLTDDRVLSTVHQSEKAFREAMEINHYFPLHEGIYIPRYPKDDYDGFDVGMGRKGNPWVIGNFRWADYYYRIAKELRLHTIEITDLNIGFFTEGLGLSFGQKRSFEPRSPEHRLILETLERKGDSLVQRIMETFDNPEFKKPASAEQQKNIFFFLGEQIHRSTGENTGSQGLTWNAAAALRTGQAWQELQRAKGSIDNP